jgi:HK97 family phage major capsid protein
MQNAFDKIVKENADRIDAILSAHEKDKSPLTKEENAEIRMREDFIEKAKEDAGKTVRSPQLSGGTHMETLNFHTRGLIGGLGSPKQLFYRGRSIPGGERTMAQYLSDVVQGKTLVPDEGRSMSLGTGALGGFAAPEKWAAGFWTEVNTASVFLPRCRVFNFDGAGTLHITAWDSEDQTLGPFGGVQAQWKEESGTFTPVDPKIRAMTMSPHKLGIFVDVTREAAQDAGTLVAELGAQMSGSVAFEFDDKIMNGTDIGQPYGILNAPSAINVNRATGNTIEYADVIGLYRRMWPGFLNGAAWFCSPEVIGELLEMEDTAGSLIWMPSAEGVGAARPGYLLGAPVYVTDKCATLGTRGDLILANLGAYAVGVRQDVVLERTESAKWYQDIYSFRAILRADGMPLLNTAIKPKNGGPTLSWCGILN